MIRSTRRPTRRRRRHTGAKIGLALFTVALLAVAVWYVALFPKQAEKTVYPLAYEEMIASSAREFGLDPARVAAVIYCESSFRVSAVSSAGAVGLMQIMPSTRAWIAEKLNIENYSEESLYDPATNIRLGCWYLNYLNDRFGGDLTKVTAAYHAGGGKVDEWLKDERYSSDGETLAELPDNATGAYVQAVARAYDIYKEKMDT